MRNTYKTVGEITRVYLQVKDGKRLSALIDTADLPRANEMGGTWYALWSKYTKTYYVRGNTLPDENKQRKVVSLHRFIMGLDVDKQVDHISHDTLDNRRSNLRWGTRSENQQNRVHSVGISGIKGITWHDPTKQWRVRIGVDRKSINIGLFVNLEDAKIAIKEARLKYHPFNTLQ